MLNVALVQPDTLWHDAAANFAAVDRLAADVEAGTLVVLPEMFASGFTMDVAAASAGDVAAFCADLARRRGVHLIAGLVVRAADGRGLNQCVAYDPAGTEIGRYSKIHPFTFAGESDHYAAGESVVVVPIGGFRVGLSVCYDLRFPETYRALVAAGADVLVNVANWPASRVAHWDALLKARAIENQCYVLGVNRVGHDPNGAYPGPRRRSSRRPANCSPKRGRRETVLHANARPVGRRGVARALPISRGHPPDRRTGGPAVRPLSMFDRAASRSDRRSTFGRVALD